MRIKSIYFMSSLHVLLIAFGVQGLRCLTQMNDERLVLTRFLKDTKKGKRVRGVASFPKCGVTTPARDSTSLVQKHEIVSAGGSPYPTYSHGHPLSFFTLAQVTI